MQGNHCWWHWLDGAKTTTQTSTFHNERIIFGMGARVTRMQKRTQEGSKKINRHSMYRGSDV
jgi:hypothetical protein